VIEEPILVRIEMVRADDGLTVVRARPKRDTMVAAPHRPDVTAFVVALAIGS
jgi:hypothetical protein